MSSIQNFLNKLGLALTILQVQRQLELKQYEDKEDYTIRINSAKTFFDDYSYFVKQRMSKCTLEEEQVASKVFDVFEKIAMDALIDTLISSAYRIPKKRWFNVFK